MYSSYETVLPDIWGSVSMTAAASIVPPSIIGTGSCILHPAMALKGSLSPVRYTMVALPQSWPLESMI